MRRLVLLFIVLGMLLVACGGGGDDPTDTPPEPTPNIADATEDTQPTQDTTANQGPRDAACPALVQSALEAVDSACQGIGRNQVCYGNVRLSSNFRDGIEPPSFEQPGDIANLNDITGLTLSPMDTETNQWGVAVMRLQADIEGTVPGQVLTFLLFGDVTLEPVPGEEDGALAFYFQSGVGDAPCAEAPDSGILVQTPAGRAEVALTVNDVDIVLGSTAYLQAQPQAALTVSVVEGQAEVTAQGVTEVARAGTQTRIELDADNAPVSAPSDPQPYTGVDIQAVPVKSLDRQVDIENRVIISEFITDIDGWRIFGDGTDLEHTAPQAGEPVTAGFVCSTDDSTGVTWYYDAPDSWLGDQSIALGGNLTFALNQSADNSQYEDALVILEGDERTLTYTSDEIPAVDAFTRFIVPLTATAWIDTETSTAPDDATFEAVLADLTALRIRGEFREGADTGCLDYVQITSIIEAIQPYVPPPRQSATAFRTDVQAATIGLSISESIAQPGEEDVYTFIAEAGQRVFFDAQGEDSAQVRWSVEGPDGETLFSDETILSNVDPGLYTLSAGEYTILVDGSDDVTSAYAFQLWKVPAPPTFEITLDEPVFDGAPGTGSGHIESPGVQDIYTLTIAEQTTVYFDGTGSLAEIRWDLAGPDGNVIFEDETTLGNVDPGRYTLDAGTYTLTGYGRGDATGLYSFVIHTVPDPQTFTYTVGDTAAGEIESVGAEDIYAVEVEAGTTLFVDSTTRTVDGALNWSITDSEGATIFSDTFMGNSALGNYPFNRGGEYTIRVYGDGTATGSYTFTLSVVAEGESTALDDAPTVTEGGVLATLEGDIGTAGEEDTYTLAVEAGQIVYFDAIEGSSDILWSASDASGERLFNGSWTRESSDPGRYTLETSGDITMTVTGRDDATGAYNLQIWQVPDTITTPVAIQQFDPSLPPTEQPGIQGEIAFVGQEVAYTFEAEPGQIVYFDAQQGGSDILWTLTDSRGERLFNGNWTRPNSDPGRYELGLGGTYTMRFDGQGTTTGPFAFAVYEVPPTQTGSVAIAAFDTNQPIDAQPRTDGQINISGETTNYTFEAQAGDIVYFDARDGSSEIWWTTTDPDGNNVFSGNWTRPNSDPGRYTLPTTGTYTMTFDGRGDFVGAFAFAIYAVPPTTTTAIDFTVFDRFLERQNGIEGAINIPGQVDQYTFNGEAGQAIYFDAIEGSSTIWWTTTDPDGNDVFTNGWTRPNNDQGVITLPVDGTYTMTFDGRDDTLGPFAFALYEVPPTETIATQVQTFDPNIEFTEQIIRGEISVPGQMAVYTFDAAEGETIYYDVIGAEGNLRWGVIGPDETVIFADNALSRGIDPGRIGVPVDGTYTLSVSGRGAAAGDFAVALWQVAPTLTFQINIGDSITIDAPAAGAGALQSPGEIDVYQFEATEGTELVFEAQGGGDDMGWVMTGPDGEQITRSGFADGTTRAVTLPADGVYTIQVSDQGPDTGQYNFTIQTEE